MHVTSIVVAVVQPLSHVQLFANPWTAAPQASLPFTISQSLLKLMSIESMMQPSHPLLPTSPLALSLSQHQGIVSFTNYLLFACIFLKHNSLLI